MTKAINIGGRMLSFSQMKINTADQKLIEEQLQKATAGQSMFLAIPVILDLAVELDLSALLALTKKYNMTVIGVVDGSHNSQAQQLGLAVLPRDKALPKLQESTASAPEVIKTKTTKTAVMLRSGQQILNPDGDVVVRTDVNRGAEAIAFGNLHVYGKGQGRLVAGANGDTSAMIFCQYFDPDLVSVAGTYAARDTIAPELIGKALCIKYEKDTGLVFTPLDPKVQ